MKRINKQSIISIGIVIILTSNDNTTSTYVNYDFIFKTHNSFDIVLTNLLNIIFAGVDLNKVRTLLYLPWR